MRIFIQRVKMASVSINGLIKSQIGQGLMVLVGIEEADTQEDIDWLSGKILQLRIFSDLEGKMNLSIGDVQGDLLIVSQFTLHASTKKGNRPSWGRAARGEVSQPLFEGFVTRLSAALGRPVATGVFGADMQVSLVNDGPVTVAIDSRNPQ